MGNRRKLRKVEEARTTAGRRFLLWGLVVLFLGAASWRFWPSPAREESRLIQLAGERGVFIFGSHGDADDFALSRPFLEEVFQEAQARGKRVVFIDELGSVGYPKDSATGKLPPVALWLEAVERDPVGTQAQFHERIAEQREGGGMILRGEYFAPSFYDQPSGSYMKALHDCLIQHRALLAGVDNEDLGWEDYLEDLRLMDLETRSSRAYQEGKPDEYERLVREAGRRQDAVQASRDRRLVLQMGRCLDGREDLLVVTVRGIAHWDMVARHGIKQGRRLSWETLIEDAFGQVRIDMHRFAGSPLDPKGEQHAILEECLAEMLQAHLRGTGRCRSFQEGARRIKPILDDPALTLERLRELSVALGKAHPSDNTKACAFAWDWLGRRGFKTEMP